MRERALLPPLPLFSALLTLLPSSAAGWRYCAESGSQGRRQKKEDNLICFK